MNQVEIYLKINGPSRSRSVADYLQHSLGLSPEAARKRISRAGKQVRSIAGMLPKKKPSYTSKKTKELLAFKVPFWQLFEKLDRFMGLLSTVSKRGRDVCQGVSLR